MRAAPSRLATRLVAVILLAWLASSAVFALGASPPTLAAPARGLASATVGAQSARPLVSQVATIGFTVSDLARSIDYFTTLLDFALVEQFEVNDREFDVLQGVFGANARIAHLRLGDQVLELTQYLTPQGRPIPVPSQSNDLWFQHIAIVVSDLDPAVARLKAAGVAQISTEAITIPPSNEPAAGVRAFKFRDPDAHPLELLYFPPDKRPAAWQQPGGRLFLGIDHTAIGVSDTQQSRRFYEDALGLRLGGQSFNAGPTQELLDNLMGVTVQISGLLPPIGPPNVELLDYRTPATGRPYPADATAADLLHWQSTFVVDDAERAFDALTHAGGRLVSPRVAAVSDPRLGFRRGFMARDPDGHALRLVER